MNKKNGKKKVIVIGAGLSGLTASIYALKAGFDVTLYERNYSVGGLCTGWNRKGTYIDGCIHWLTESDKGSLNKVWYEIGALDKSTEIFHYEAYSQTVCSNGDVVNFYTNVKKLKAELMRFAKGNDAKLINKFIKGVATCTTNAITVRRPFHLWKLMDKLKFIVQIFPIAMVFKNYSKLNVSEYTEQFESETLKFVLNNALVPKEFSLFSLVSTFGGLATRNGGTPIGGSKAFIERVKDKFLSLNGKLVLRADVDEIVLEGRQATGIKLSDGTFAEADYVIPACDVHFTLEKLLKNRFRVGEIIRRDMDKVKHPTYSMMLVSFRTKKNLSGVECNRYIQCKPYKVLGNDFDVLYLKHFGYDKTLENDGYTVVQAIVTTSEDMYDALEKMPREEYVAFKKELAQQQLELINTTDGESYGELELLDVATPLTFTHYVNAYKGTFMTYMLTANNEMMKLRNDILPIDNLALANQWVMMPGGLPIAAMQGKFAAMTIADIDAKKELA